MDWREATRTLPDAQALRSACVLPDLDRDHKWTTKSVWLINLIEDIATREYPYNAVVQREAERLLGLPRMDDNGSTLSILVYNAQGFRRQDKLVAAGYSAISQEMVEAAFEAGKRIEMSGDMGKILLTPKRSEADGKVHLFKARKRKSYVVLCQQAAKIVD